MEIILIKVITKVNKYKMLITIIIIMIDRNKLVAI